MNFRFTKVKTTISMVLGLAIGLFLSASGCIGGPCPAYTIIIVFAYFSVIFMVIFYVILSLFWKRSAPTV